MKTHFSGSEKVINVPPRGSSSLPGIPDMPLHATEASRALCRPGIHKPTGLDHKIPECSGFYSDPFAMEYQAVNTLIHILARAA